MTYGGILSSGTQVGAAYGQGREKKDPQWNKDLLLERIKFLVQPEHDRFEKAQPYKAAMLV